MNKEKRIEWEEYRYNSDGKKEIEFDESDDDNESEKLPSILQTPFGLFRLDDSLNPFKQFRFWLANTNFNLGRGAKKTLNSVNGVEAIIFLSRYKFIVGIGKLFDEAEVKSDIEKIFTSSKTSPIIIYEDKELNVAVHKIQTMLENTHKYWVIYAFPNGNIDYFNDKELKPVMIKYRFYKIAQSYSRGQIIISHEIQKKIKNETNNK